MKGEYGVYRSAGVGRHDNSHHEQNSKSERGEDIPNSNRRGKKGDTGGIWSYDPGDEPPPFPKKYVDVNTHQFILKYNNLLSKSKKLERRAALDRKRARNYKRKLAEVRSLCAVGPSSGSDTE